MNLWIPYYVSAALRGQERVLEPLELELQMFVGHRMSAGKWTQVIYKNNKYSTTEPSLLLKKDLFISVYECCACICFGTVCTWSPQPRRGHSSTGAGVNRGCEMPYECRETNGGSPRAASALTMGPPLQLHHFYLYLFFIFEITSHYVALTVLEVTA